MSDPKKVFGDIRRAREDMEHLMRQMFGQSFPLLRPVESKWQPNVDVYESEGKVIVVAELAGVERDDVTVTFDRGRIIFSGLRKDNVPAGNRKYCQMEINYNQFERVVFLPAEIDPERITAKLSNGIMVVEAPRKRPEKPMDCRVEIR